MNQLLLVEDDASIRESLVDFFRGRDWLVHPCADLHAATQAIAHQRFHTLPGHRKDHAVGRFGQCGYRGIAGEIAHGRCLRIDRVDTARKRLEIDEGLRPEALAVGRRPDNGDALRLDQPQQVGATVHAPSRGDRGLARRIMHWATSADAC